jgi:hypothetical protein
MATKTQYYRYNALTRVLTAEPRYIVTLDRRTIVNPSAEQYATLRDAYPKGEDAPMPEPQEGKIVEYGGYALGEDSKWHKQWVLVDAPPKPPKPPRTFNRYKVLTALKAEGVWKDIRAALLAQDEDALDMLYTAEDISDDEPLLLGMIAVLKAAPFSWTDEKIESILAEAQM